MEVLIIDNYDSFTYNLVHYFEELNCNVTVKRNDQLIVEELGVFDVFVLSPGPGLPKEAGVLMEVIDFYFSKKPILGVCLGMQALAEYSGDILFNQQQVKHGISETCKKLRESKIFSNLPSEFQVGLYHSWGVKLNKNSNFIPVAISENEVLMAIEHEVYPVVGVQFHPESILTPLGKEMILNFITYYC
jgi:anthranilate synthase component 2